MSKSFGNYVGVAEPAAEQFGKLMSIPDALMWRWWELCTDLSLEGIQAMKQQVASGGLHPRAAKAGLAVREMTLIRHDIFTADECFLTGSAAEVIPVVKLDSRVIGDGKPGPITKKLIERFVRLTRE